MMTMTVRLKSTRSRRWIVRRAAIALAAALLPLAASRGAVAQTPSQSPSQPDVIIPVFDEVPIELDRTIIDGTLINGVRTSDYGCTIETAIALPPLPHNQRDARRIVATIIVDPVIKKLDDKIVPGDPWTRLGSLRIVLPPDDELDNPEGGAAPAGKSPATNPPATRPASPGANKPGKGRTPVAPPVTPPPPPANRELELIRFITPFGGPATFEQDVTALAPFLHDHAVLRLSLGTIGKPAWRVTVTLRYATDGVGYRRPVWADPVLLRDEFTAERNTAKVKVEVPPGLARPRLRIISTGHATDGTGGDEFVSRTHVLRIDGLEVARFRPWAEEGGSLRQVNPMSGREAIQGRELWSSDIDRSGWRAGKAVEPLIIPVPELLPGKVHTVELEILNIRPKDQLGNHGFWRVSIAAVADEPWPDDDAADAPSRR